MVYPQGVASVNLTEFPSREFAGIMLTRPAKMVSIDELEVSRRQDPRVIVLTDFDGVHQPLELDTGEMRVQRPWKTYVDLFNVPHVPERLKAEVAVGVSATLDRLPVQVLSLSTRYDTTQSTLDHTFATLRMTPPEWQILDARRKQPDIENYTPKGDVHIPRTPTHFKVFTVLRLIDRIAKRPIEDLRTEDRRTIAWFEDDLHNQPELVDVMREYAERQGVQLLMPDIKPHIGATPNHLEALAVHCQESELRVPRDYLIDPCSSRTADLC